MESKENVGKKQIHVSSDRNDSGREKERGGRRKRRTPPQTATETHPSSGSPITAPQVSSGPPPRGPRRRHPDLLRLRERTRPPVRDRPPPRHGPGPDHAAGKNPLLSERLFIYRTSSADVHVRGDLSARADCLCKCTHTRRACTRPRARFRRLRASSILAGRLERRLMHLRAPGSISIIYIFLVLLEASPFLFLIGISRESSLLLHSGERAHGRARQGERCASPFPQGDSP